MAIKKQRHLQSKSYRPPRTLDEYYALPENIRTGHDNTNSVIAKMRNGQSLKSAAKEAGVSPAIVTTTGGRALKRRKNGSYAVTRTDNRLRIVLVPTPAGMQEVPLRNSDYASTVSRYWHAVTKYLRTGDASGLKKFRRRFVKDADGVKIPLITDTAELDRLGSAGALSFESLYARAA